MCGNLQGTIAHLNIATKTALHRFRVLSVSYSCLMDPCHLSNTPNLDKSILLTMDGTTNPMACFKDGSTNPMACFKDGSTNPMACFKDGTWFAP